MKSSFVLHFEQAALFDAMSDAQAGQLIKRIFQHAMTGDHDKPEDNAVLFPLLLITPRMDAEAKAYREKCEKHKECGKLGGRPAKNQLVVSETKRLDEKPNGFFENPSDTVSDSDSDSNTNFKPSGVVADAPTPAGIPAGAREERDPTDLTEEPQAEPQAVDEPSPAPTPTPKPKRTHDDHRPKDCPPEAWKFYLQISRGFHTDKAEQLGARAPFSESKVIEGAKVMDTLIRLKGQTENDVIAVLGWSTEDEFWSQNLRSMKALLKASRTNGELKYTNILHAMDRAIERKIEREMAARAMQ